MTTRPENLLRHRDFRLLWLGETTSSLGSMVSTVALPLVAVLTLHASVFLVGALEAAAWLPWLFVGLFAGAVVDRLPRRPVMIAADVASALLLASVPVAAWCGVLTIAQLLAVALLAGTAAVFFATAYRAYLPALVAAEHRARANATLQGSESAAQVAGPGLGGLLAQLFGAVAGLLADAAGSLVSAACLLLVRTREPDRAARTTSLRAEIGQGIGFVARDPYLRTIAIGGAAANLALNGVQAVLVVFLVRIVGVGAGAVGAILAAIGVGGVLGALASGRIARRFGTAHGLLLCELGAAPFALLIPLTGKGWGLAYVIGGGFVLVAGIVASNVIGAGFRQAYCPPEMLGRVTASGQFLSYGAIPVGALLGGALGGTIGVRPTLWLMAAGCVLASSVLLSGPIRRARDLPTAPEPIGAPASME